MNKAKLTIDIITIFPNFFKSPLREGLIYKALKKGLIKINVHNLRDYATKPHYQVDDQVFGGGAGMVFKPEPLYKALKSIKKPGGHVILTTPRGSSLTQSMAQRLKKYKQLIIICGRYEGIDQRITDNFVDEQISIGDYILNGGEAAALVITEVTSRLIKGVVAKKDSITEESFSSYFLDHFHYTRPATFLNHSVPEVLRSGHHTQIENWRLYSRMFNTFYLRPELLKNAKLSLKEKQALKEIISKEIKFYEPHYC